MLPMTPEGLKNEAKRLYERAAATSDPRARDALIAVAQDYERQAEEIAGIVDLDDC